MIRGLFADEFGFVTPPSPSAAGCSDGGFLAWLATVAPGPGPAAPAVSGTARRGFN